MAEKARRRGWWAVAVLFVAIAALMPWAWQEFFIVERYSISPQLTVVETRKYRFGDRMIESSIWELETGMRVIRVRYPKDGIQLSNWDPQGKLRHQSTMDKVAGVETDVRGAPPWLWGDSDLTEPDAPWIREGLEFDEWFRIVDAKGRVDPPTR